MKYGIMCAMKKKGELLLRMADEKKTSAVMLDSISCGDCEELMKQLPDNSVDLIFTSPPYADQRVYGNLKCATIAPDSYVEWFAPKAREMYRILKDDGSFILNINDKVVDGFQHLFVLDLVIYLCRVVNFHLVRDYVWYNPATPPNIYSSGKFGRTKKSHEYCYWFSKSDKWVFNLDAIRKPYGKSMQKYLNGEGKGARRNNTRPSTHSFDCEKVWLDHGGADPGSIIQISNTASTDSFFKMCKELGIKHPARFPVKLAEFFIKAGSNENAVVLDPFMGSGTTAVAAKRLSRHWIGFELNKDYCNLATRRVSEVKK